MLILAPILARHTFIRLVIWLVVMPRALGAGECCYEAAESMLDTSNLEDDYLRDTQEYIDKGVVREEFLTQARKEA